MLLKELDASYGLAGKTNYIFYMSEMEERPVNGHFRKMDRSREVLRQLSQNVRNCKVMRYSDYSGERLDGASVGVVFPAHSWGISLAVFAFFNHLRLETGAYVYAVAVGETVSAEDAASVRRCLKPLEQFTELFERRTAGHTADIFVRCNDLKRSRPVIMEDRRYHNKAEREEVSSVLESLMFVNREKLTDENYIKDRSLTVSLADAEAMYESINMRTKKRSTEKTYAQRFGKGAESAMPAVKPAVKSTSVHMGNVFLDDSVFSGLRLQGVV